MKVFDFIDTCDQTLYIHIYDLNDIDNEEPVYKGPSINVIKKSKYEYLRDKEVIQWGTGQGKEFTFYLGVEL